jgi:predicted nucleic acid-binding protein
MTSGYQAVLDACVLVRYALRDTLLRLAESPALYLPRWSDEIIAETKRTLENKLNLTPQKTAHLIHQLRVSFEDAWVEGYEPLIATMDNHLKDRHVLAAAVKTGAQTIVTFNLKDFKKEALDPWNVEAQHPDAFLIHQYYLDPDQVIKRLKQQAALYVGGFEELLAIHQRTVPAFVQLVRFHTPDKFTVARSGSKAGPL